jgi:glycosyltransferase involved in cell wall biosynthesis
MRILKVVQAYYPFQEKGGPVVKVRALAQELVRRGHQVTVLTADLGIAQRNGASPSKFERCEWGWRLEEAGVETFYLPTVFHYRALTVNPRVAAFCRASLKRFELAHFYGLYDLLGPAVSHYCRSYKIPYVIEPMGMYLPIDRGFFLKRVWHRTVGRAFRRNAAQIVATSEMEHQELIESGIPAAKLVIRYNGIDAASCAPLPARGCFREKWGVPKEEPLVLFLSRLIPRKGADILIEAFAQACPESGRLVIAGPEGEAGYRNHLEKCAQNSGVTSRVIFTGPLYDEDKKAVLSDADVFALPSRYENFANAAAEAIACGIPVIITDSCGIRSLVEGHAGLIAAPRRESFADALRKLIYDKRLYAQFKEGCRGVASQLSWNDLTGRMESYYEAALAKSNGAH